MEARRLDVLLGDARRDGHFVHVRVDIGRGRSLADGDPLRVCLGWEGEDRHGLPAVVLEPFGGLEGAGCDELHVEPRIAEVVVEGEVGALFHAAECAAGDPAPDDDGVGHFGKDRERVLAGRKVAEPFGRCDADEIGPMFARELLHLLGKLRHDNIASVVQSVYGGGEGSSWSAGDLPAMPFRGADTPVRAW